MTPRSRSASATARVPVTVDLPCPISHILEGCALLQQISVAALIARIVHKYAVTTGPIFHEAAQHEAARRARLRRVVAIRTRK